MNIVRQESHLTWYEVWGPISFLRTVEQVFVDLLIVIDPYIADYVSLINFAQKIRETKKFP